MSEPTEKDIQELQDIIERYEIKLPRKWEEWSWSSKLDYVGERILMGTRTSKKHSYLKEQGWLSSSQLERRRRREVYGRTEDFRDIPINPRYRVVNNDSISDYTVPSGGFPVTVITGVVFLTTSGENHGQEPTNV